MGSWCAHGATWLLHLTRRVAPTPSAQSALLPLLITQASPGITSSCCRPQLGHLSTQFFTRSDTEPNALLPLSVQGVSCLHHVSTTPHLSHLGSFSYLGCCPETQGLHSSSNTVLFLRDSPGLPQLPASGGHLNRAGPSSIRPRLGRRTGNRDSSRPSESSVSLSLYPTKTLILGVQGRAPGPKAGGLGFI